MTTERIDIRLDPERRRKLDDLTRLRGESISVVMRKALDHFYDDALRERRLEAVRRLSEMNIEDVPDPEELSRQLNSTYDIGPLY